MSAGNNTPSTVVAVDPETMPSKRKAKPSTCEDNTQDLSIVSDVPEKKQKRVRRKQETLECTTVEDDSRAVVKKKECSSIEEVIGKFISGA